MSARASSYFPNLTGLRGVAAAWVLAYHAWLFAGAPALGILTPLVKCGYFGVDLFFVLSGFLLSLPFHRTVIEGRPPPSLRSFWLHRCRRVLPAYWLQLLVLVAVYLCCGQPATLSLRDLIAQALLAQNLVPWPVPPLNPVYWSMPVEWDFYALLPLLALVFAHCRWQLSLALVLAFTVGFRVLCYSSLTDNTLATFVTFADVHQLPGRLDQFFVGMCAAWIVVRRPPASPRGAMACLFAGIAAILVMATIAAPRDDFLARGDVPYLYVHHSLTALSFGLLILGAGSSSRFGSALFGNRPMMFLGFISYSLYLWHYSLLQAMQGLGWIDGGRAPSWIVVAFAALPLILLVSWVSARYVEQPFLQKRSAASRAALIDGPT